MNKLHLFLLAALSMFACAELQAQVTIGGLTAPATGALLDLNSTAKGGLVLSNVSLTNVGVIPQSFPGVTSENYHTDAVKSRFRGAAVYHTGENDIPAGVYVWNGSKWIPSCVNPNVSSVYDAEGNKYTTGYFAAAGWWMTQNLRTTTKTYSDGTRLEKGTDDIAADKRYTYPGASSDANEREAAFTKDKRPYGLLYSWAAASGRTDAIVDNDDGAGGVRAGFGDKEPAPADYHQGICPTGWHLPSDWEWSQLEREIARNPGDYSSQTDVYPNLDAYNFFPNSNDYIWRPGQGVDIYMPDDITTYWGRAMKSEQTFVNDTDPQGTSKSRSEGGFDALLLGYVFKSSVSGYGSAAFFWTSSSNDKNGNSVQRQLESGFTGIGRGYAAKYLLLSVRCKKD
jgi:uncharacterized protein (TIGR02145 family)